jgi:hypothetical protein
MLTGNIAELMKNVDEKVDSYDINKDHDLKKQIIPEF